MEEKELKNAEKILNQIGYTLPELIVSLSRYNSTLLMLKAEDQSNFEELYREIGRGGLTKNQKGQKLEELTSLLFQKSIENLFNVYRNCRTSSNEIDLLIRWTEEARLSGICTAFPCFGEVFLCECKNYNGAVSVTFVGKFSSLMTVTGTDFGVIISWDGVSGRSNWSDSKGLIKKIALHEGKYIVVIDKYDLEQIYKKKNSILSIIYNKYLSLKTDISYEKYIQKHEAEGNMTKK